MIISILTANLITNSIDNYVLKYKHSFNPYVFTWIGMLIVVIVFYPLFTWLDKFSENFAGKFIKAGKKITGKKAGVVLSFIIALLVLYYLYGKVWFNVNVLFSMIKASVN